MSFRNVFICFDFCILYYVKGHICCILTYIYFKALLQHIFMLCSDIFTCFVSIYIFKLLLPIWDFSTCKRVKHLFVDTPSFALFEGSYTFILSISSLLLLLIQLFAFWGYEFVRISFLQRNFGWDCSLASTFNTAAHFSNKYIYIHSSVFYNSSKDLIILKKSWYFIISNIHILLITCHCLP